MQLDYGELGIRGEEHVTLSVVAERAERCVGGRLGVDKKMLVLAAVGEKEKVGAGHAEHVRVWEVEFLGDGLLGLKNFGVRGREPAGMHVCEESVLVGGKLRGQPAVAAVVDGEDCWVRGGDWDTRCVGNSKKYEQILLNISNYKLSTYGFEFLVRLIFEQVQVWSGTTVESSSFKTGQTVPFKL